MSLILYLSFYAFDTEPDEFKVVFGAIYYFIISVLNGKPRIERSKTCSSNCVYLFFSQNANKKF